MDDKDIQQGYLYQDVVEKSLNNSAAINVLVDLVVGSGLISIDDFNDRVQNEAKHIKKEMYEKVDRSTN